MRRKEIRRRISELEKEWTRICLEKRRKGADEERLKQRVEEIREEVQSLKKKLRFRNFIAEEHPSILMLGGWSAIVLGILTMAAMDAVEPGLSIAIGGIIVACIGIFAGMLQILIDQY